MLCVRSDIDTSDKDVRQENKFAFLAGNCCQSTEEEQNDWAICKACNDATRALVRKCYNESRTRKDQSKKRPYNSMQSPTDLKRANKRLAKKNKNLRKKNKRLEKKIKELASHWQEGDISQELKEFLGVKHIADIFRATASTELMEHFLQNETVERRDLYKLLQKESLLQAVVAQERGRSACRYSPVMLKLAIELYCKLGEGRYEFVAQCFNMPVARQVRNYTSKGAKDPDGVMYTNLMEASQIIHDEFGNIHMTDHRRFFNLCWDSFKINDRLVFDATTNTIVGIAHDDSVEFDVVAAARVSCTEVFESFQDMLSDEDDISGGHNMDETAEAGSDAEMTAVLGEAAVVEEAMQTDSKSEKVVGAKHYLVFLAKNLCTEGQMVKVTVARYALHSLDHRFLSKVIPEIVDAMYHCGLVVVQHGYDGASENRTAVQGFANLTVQDLIDHGSFPKDWESKPNIPLKMKIAYWHPCFEKKDNIIIFLHSDMPHLIKKIVNALERTDQESSTDLHFRRKKMSLLMIHKLWERSKTDGSPLRKFKFSNDHFFKTNTSRMRVYLAVNITSSSSVLLIDRYAGDDKEEYAPFREVLLSLDKLIDIVNAREQKRFYPVQSPTSEYIPPLLSSVQLFTEWKEQVGGNKNQFIPLPSYQDLCCVCFSTIALASHYTKVDGSVKLDQGRLGSDDCEHRFCSIKAKGGTQSVAAAHTANAKGDAQNLSNTSSLNCKARNNAARAPAKRKDLTSKLRAKRKVRAPNKKAKP